MIRQNESHNGGYSADYRRGSTGVAPWCVFIGRGHSERVSLKNTLLLILDVVVGSGLILLLFIGIRSDGICLIVLITTGILTHLFRDVTVLSGHPNPFCANTALFVGNNLKLSGLLIPGYVALFFMIE